MNLKIYSSFDLNHPVDYFSFGNLFTFCMDGLTRKQPIRGLVLDDFISKSFLPDQSLTFSSISHDSIIHRSPPPPPMNVHTIYLLTRSHRRDSSEWPDRQT